MYIINSKKIWGRLHTRKEFDEYMSKFSNIEFKDGVNQEMECRVIEYWKDNVHLGSKKYLSKEKKILEIKYLKEQLDYEKSILEKIDNGELNSPLFIIGNSRGERREPTVIEQKEIWERRIDDLIYEINELELEIMNQ